MWLYREQLAQAGVTDETVHDSQVVEDILDLDNTASDVWADSAYRSAQIEAKLKEEGLNNLAYNMRRLVQLERLAAVAPT